MFSVQFWGRDWLAEGAETLSSAGLPVVFSGEGTIRGIPVGVSVWLVMAGNWTESLTGIIIPPSIGRLWPVMLVAFWAIITVGTRTRKTIAARAWTWDFLFLKKVFVSVLHVSALQCTRTPL